MSDAESTLPTLAPLALADSCISHALRDVLTVFDDDGLCDVKFPDVDNDALQAQAAQVEERFKEMKRLEAALEDARKKLDEAQEALLSKAQRAVAYARVYAEGDVLLSSRLESISLPRPKARTTATTTTMAETPKKRGRPKNQPAADSSLFHNGSNSNSNDSSEGAAVAA